MPYTARRARVFLWLLGLVASPASAAIECPGILSKNGRACCPSFCNACGDKKCEEAPGGAELCWRTSSRATTSAPRAALRRARCRHAAAPASARALRSHTHATLLARADAAALRTAPRLATRGSTTTSSTRRAIPSARRRSRAEVQVQDVRLVHAAVAAAESHPPPPPPPPVLDAMGAFKYTVVKSWSRPRRRGRAERVGGGEEGAHRLRAAEGGHRAGVWRGKVDADATYRRTSSCSSRSDENKGFGWRGRRRRTRDRRRRSSRACRSRRRRRRRRRRAAVAAAAAARAVAAAVAVATAALALRAVEGEGPRDDVVVARRSASTGAPRSRTTPTTRSRRTRCAARARTARRGRSSRRRRAPRRRSAGSSRARGMSSACGRRARRGPARSPTRERRYRPRCGRPTRRSACRPRSRRGVHGGQARPPRAPVGLRRRLVMVQMREGGGAGGSQANWVPVPEGVTRGAATIEDLEPYTAYVPRRQLERQGHLAARPAVGAARTAGDLGLLRAPPTVRRLDGASFTVQWPASACRPKLRWAILFAPAAAVAAAAAPSARRRGPRWRRAAGRAQEVRAPGVCADGRVFAVRSADMRVDGYASRRRRRRRSARRSCRRRGAARRASASGCAAARAARGHPAVLVDDLAHALAVDHARLVLVAAPAEGRGYAVLDVLPGDGGAPRSSPPRSRSR